MNFDHLKFQLVKFMFIRELTEFLEDESKVYFQLQLVLVVEH